MELASPVAPTHRRGILGVALAALIWSSGGLFIKLAPMPALAVVAGRGMVTAAFFLLVFRPALSRARLSTALAYAGMIITFVTATKWTTAANAIFLQYTGTVWVLVLAPLLLKERFRRLDAAFILLSLAGTALVLSSGAEASVGERRGDLIAVISGLFFATTLVLLRRDATAPAAGGPGADVMASTALGNLLAAALTLPFALGDLGPLLAPRGALVILYLGLVQMGLAYAIFNRALRGVPAATASLVAMLEPVVNPIWVFLGTGERPHPGALVGGAVVLAVVAVRAALRP
jgi:drug/metabolite transporter, DME family